MKQERINLTRKEIWDTIDKIFKEMDAPKRGFITDWRYMPLEFQRMVSDSLKKEFAANPIILRPVDE